MKSLKIFLFITLIILILLFIPNMSKASWKGYTTKKHAPVYKSRTLSLQINAVPTKGTGITIISEDNNFNSYRVICKIKGKKVDGFMSKKDVLIIRVGSFTKTASDIHKYLRTNGYKYNSDNLKALPLNIKNAKITDCSHYVSAVLIEYSSKYKSIMKKSGSKYKQLNTNNFNSFGKSLKSGKSTYKNYFSLVSKKNAKAGDILVYNYHVEILAESLGNKKSGYKVYNCGCNSAIKSAETSKSSHTADRKSVV